MPTPARKPRSLAEECADDLARLHQPVVKPGRAPVAPADSPT